MFTIHSARKIITMNVRRPVASHVAVRDGWILGAGALEELAGWGPHAVDDRFADKVIMPASRRATATAARAAAGTRPTSDSTTGWRRTGWSIPG